MDCSNMSFNADAMLEEVRSMYEGADPAHGFSHIFRVYHNARYIGELEGADMQVLLLSALLHDVGSRSKSIECSAKAGLSSQDIAEEFLNRKGFPKDVIENIGYAIGVHRFSKGIVPITLEAKILQDADRLDAMGAIGIARVFLTGGSLRRPLYNPEDPFCSDREPDDSKWNLDHFFTKLLKLEWKMHTQAGKKLAEKRGLVLKRYLSDLREELEGFTGEAKFGDKKSDRTSEDG